MTEKTQEKVIARLFPYKSRIEELIFKSIFDYFDADKFYVITEKRDDICIELCSNINLLEVNELHKDEHNNFFITYYIGTDNYDTDSMYITKEDEVYPKLLDIFEKFYNKQK